MDKIILLRFSKIMRIAEKRNVLIWRENLPINAVRRRSALCTLA